MPFKGKESAYDVSDSDEDYSQTEKLLLEEARNSMKKRVSEDDEVYGFGFDEDEALEDDKDPYHGVGNDSDENENENDIDMGSDLDGEEEHATDGRAWGARKQRFHGGDNLDQDYGGMFQGDDAEAAELEEQEARNIQKRLVEQLNDADFSLSDVLGAEEATSEMVSKEEIKADLSTLSKRQKLDLLKKESPEFFNLVDDFKFKLTEVKEKIVPILDLVEEKKLPSTSAVDYLRTKMQIIINYCTNLSFYLLLKAKRISVKDHPVLKSLFHYRKLLQQMEPVDKEIIDPQVEDILKSYKSKGEINIKKPSKKLLMLLKKDQSRSSQITDGTDVKENKFQEEEKEDTVVSSDDEEEMEEDEDDEEEEEKQQDKDQNDLQKRGITYSIAKNKGLTPRRKKEVRNPRVKHRNKYKKALVRRRGQVRHAREEIPYYGGEPTGIKANVTKSVKFK